MIVNKLYYSALLACAGRVQPPLYPVQRAHSRQDLHRRADAARLGVRGGQWVMSNELNSGIFKQFI